jgi:endonuclease
MIPLSEFARAIDQSAQSKHSLVALAHCSVDYSGRAESHLGDGDRIIILKADNTLLIHQPLGSTPVNYMKGGAVHTMKSEKNTAILRSQNLALKEFMTVTISKVYSMHAHHLKDGEKIRLVGTERDMAEHIMNNPGLISEDFSPLSAEEHTKYGFIDVFGHNRDGTLIVVECKRYTGTLSAVTQLRRYVEKIKALRGIDAVSGVLACPRVSQNALKMLNDWGFSHAAVSAPKYLEKYDRFQTRL